MDSNMTTPTCAGIPFPLVKRQQAKGSYTFSCQFDGKNWITVETLPDVELQYDDAGADVVTHFGRMLPASLSSSSFWDRDTCKFPMWSNHPSWVSRGSDEVFSALDSSTSRLAIGPTGIEDTWIGAYKSEWAFEQSALESETCPATAMRNIHSECNIALTGWTRPDGIETLIYDQSRSVYRKSALKELEDTHLTFAGRIQHLQELEPDWDGYGGVPITNEAAETTATVLVIAKRLDEALEDPFIAPLPSGGLQVEWEVDSGNECLVVIPPDGTNVEYLLETPIPLGDDFDATEGFLSFRNNGFRNLINQLAG